MSIFYSLLHSVGVTGIFPTPDAPAVLVHTIGCCGYVGYGWPQCGHLPHQGHVLPCPRAGWFGYGAIPPGNIDVTLFGLLFHVPDVVDVVRFNADRCVCKASVGFMSGVICHLLFSEAIFISWYPNDALMWDQAPGRIFLPHDLTLINSVFHYAPSCLTMPRAGVLCARTA